jgi:hypothetical protein
VAALTACGDRGRVHPGPKKIVVVKPKTVPTAGTFLEWGDGATTTSVDKEASATIDAYYFRTVELFEFVATNPDVRVNLTSLTLKVRDPGATAVRTILIENVNGSFDWTLTDANGSEVPLNQCNRTAGDDIPDCDVDSLGIPTEFFGELVEVTPLPAGGKESPEGDWVSARMITPKQNP